MWNAAAANHYASMSAAERTAAAATAKPRHAGRQPLDELPDLACRDDIRHRRLVAAATLSDALGSLASASPSGHDLLRLGGDCLLVENIDLFLQLPGTSVACAACGRHLPSGQALRKHRWPPRRSGIDPCSVSFLPASRFLLGRTLPFDVDGPVVGRDNVWPDSLVPPTSSWIEPGHRARPSIRGPSTSFA